MSDQSQQADISNKWLDLERNWNSFIERLRVRYHSPSCKNSIISSDNSNTDNDDDNDGQLFIYKLFEGEEDATEFIESELDESEDDSDLSLSELELNSPTSAPKQPIDHPTTRTITISPRPELKVTERVTELYHEIEAYVFMEELLDMVKYSDSCDECLPYVRAIRSQTKLKVEQFISNEMQQIMNKYSWFPWSSARFIV